MSGSQRARFTFFPVFSSLVMLAIASLACNVSFGNSLTPISTPTTNVTFIAPANNALIADGATIQLAVNATDSNSGIAKVEFLADDTVSIGIQNAPSAQANFTAIQPWKASGVQGHFLTAKVYRADGTQIGETRITVQVLAATGLPANIFASDTTGSSVTAAPVGASDPTPNTPATTGAPAAATATFVPGQPTLTVISSQGLNIRSGPGINFTVIGQLKLNDVAAVVGRNGDRTWYEIEHAGARGWVSSNNTLSQIAGDTSKIPLTQSLTTPLPASSTPNVNTGLAPTSTPGNYADLIFDSVVINPPTPKAKQTFTVTILIRNQGSVDARASYLAGIFQPGDEHSDTAVPAIKAGATASVTLFVTLKTSANNQTATLTLDAKNEIDEGPVGESNNVRQISYDVN